MAAYDAWGGSWGSSWDLTWTGDHVVVVPARPLNLGGYFPPKRPAAEILRAEVHVHGGGSVHVVVGAITEQIPRAEKLKQMLTAMAV